VPSAGWQH